VQTFEDGPNGGKLLKTCYEVACSSTSKRKVGAVLVKKNKIISVATNLETKSHPEQAKWASRAGKPNNIYLHAEIACLIKAKDGADTIIVCRVDKYGHLRMSKPCPICSMALEYAGVKNIVYSTHNGFEGIENV